MDVWRKGLIEVYKGLDCASFLSVTKQLTKEGQRKGEEGDNTETENTPLFNHIQTGRQTHMKHA